MQSIPISKVPSILCAVRCCVGVSLGLALGCGGSSGSSLIHEDRSDGGDAAEDAGPIDSGANDGPSAIDHDASPTEGAVERADLFWSAFAVDAEWVEYHPSLAEMAESADLVALASVVGLQIHEVRGNASDDVFQEGRLTLKLDEVLRGEDAPSTTLALVAAHTLGASDSTTLNSLLPLDSVLVLLRRRGNEPGVYNLVNGYGLWAQTERAEVDCPITPDLVDGVCLYRDELAAVGSVRALAEQLRP